MGYKSGQQMHQDEQFCRSWADLLYLLYTFLLMAFRHYNISIIECRKLTNEGKLFLFVYQYGITNEQLGHVKLGTHFVIGQALN